MGLTFHSWSSSSSLSLYSSFIGESNLSKEIWFIGYSPKVSLYSFCAFLSFTKFISSVAASIGKANWFLEALDSVFFLISYSARAENTQTSISVLILISSSLIPLTRASFFNTLMKSYMSYASSSVYVLHDPKLSYSHSSYLSSKAWYSSYSRTLLSLMSLS